MRAALSVHERVKAQRVHLRRLEAAIDAPVTTLPFVFESELELSHYEQLAERARLVEPMAPASAQRSRRIARRVWMPAAACCCGAR